MIKAAATWNMVIDQGKTWTRTAVFKVAGAPFDNTGWAARMMVRRNFDSTVVVSLTSAPGGGITLGGADGRITFWVSAVVMEDLAGKYVYDLELYNPSNVNVVYGVARGEVNVRREVTYV